MGDGVDYRGKSNNQDRKWFTQIRVCRSLFRLSPPFCTRANLTFSLCDYISCWRIATLFVVYIFATSSLARRASPCLIRWHRRVIESLVIFQGVQVQQEMRSLKGVPYCWLFLAGLRANCVCSRSHVCKHFPVSLRAPRKATKGVKFSLLELCVCVSALHYSKSSFRAPVKSVCMLFSLSHNGCNSYLGLSTFSLNGPDVWHMLHVKAVTLHY